MMNTLTAMAPNISLQLSTMHLNGCRNEELMGYYTISPWHFEFQVRVV